MSARSLIVTALLLAAPSAHAADACQDYAKLKELPGSFRLVSKSALGPAEMHISSDGKCTCNDLPAVQRSLGNEAPTGVNFACDAAESSESK